MKHIVMLVTHSYALATNLSYMFIVVNIFALLLDKLLFAFT